MLLRFIVASAFGALAVREIFRDDSFSSEADSHAFFLEFERNISLTQVQKKKLIASRKAIQKRIVDFFRTSTSQSVPKFFIQGSYKMGTMVLDRDGTYDVDLGIYFLAKPDVNPDTIKSYVVKAVEGHTSFQIEKKDKCVRVYYAGNFDIDLPVYYKTSKDYHPFLATKNGWLESNPKELCDWFEKKKDHTGQLIRIVKYFKYWAKIQKRKMPSGIALTVWVARNFKSDLRDDVSFYKTAKAISSLLRTQVSCISPATPEDDLTVKLNQSQKSNFKNELNNLIDYAERALKQENRIRSCEMWRELFGNRFPKGEGI